MDEASELVVVKSYSHPYEVHIDASALEAAGIASVIADEHIVRADWFMSNAVGGVKLKVRAEDLDAAREVLETAASVSADDNDSADAGSTTDASHADHLSEGDGSSGVEDSQDDVCPNCGHSDLSPVTHGRRLAGWTWLILGIPLVPVRRRTRCGNCGHEFR